MFLAIYENMDDFKGMDGFVRGLYISLVAILIVFTILVVISFCVGLLKNLNRKGSKAEQKEEATQQNVAPKSKEITDEDMMVAVLVATIDHKKETNMDAKLVSVKEIK